MGGGRLASRTGSLWPGVAGCVTEEGGSYEL